MLYSSLHLSKKEQNLRIVLVAVAVRRTVAVHLTDTFIHFVLNVSRKVLEKRPALLRALVYLVASFFFRGKEKRLGLIFHCE